MAFRKPPKPPQDREVPPRKGRPIAQAPEGYEIDSKPRLPPKRFGPPSGPRRPDPRFGGNRGSANAPAPPGRPRFEPPRGGRPPQSDRPRFDKPRSDRPTRPDRPRFDAPRGDRPPRPDRPRFDKPSGDRPPRPDRPRFDKPRGDRPPRPDRPGFGRPRGDRPPRPDRPGFGKPRGDRPGPAKNPDEPVLVVRTRRPRFGTERAAAPLTVLYEDGEVLAVDKPAGINVAVENETEQVPSLQTLAGEYLAAKGEGTALIGPRARLVHRIDKDTSGVVLFAKTPRAQSMLGRDWESGRVEKVYVALVRGAPEIEAGMIDSPIGRDPARKNLRAIGGLDAQEARTKFRVLERLAEGQYSLIEARPLTGRTHQIRVHLASIDCPLVVDPLYGESGAPRPAEISRLTLHAQSLTFPAPLDGKPRTARSEFPADFARALESLRKSVPPASTPTTSAPALRRRRRKI